MSLQTYENSQPWVVYTYLTEDPKDGSAFDSVIEAQCCVCGVTQPITLHVPAAADTPLLPQGYKHPDRVKFLSEHMHSPLPHALTWAKPLLNIAAHNETIDVLGAVARAALAVQPTTEGL